MDCWQQFNRRYCYKYKVSYSIKFRPKFTDAVSLSSDSTIYHITKTTEEIYDIKFH